MYFLHQYMSMIPLGAGLRHFYINLIDFQHVQRLDPKLLRLVLNVKMKFGTLLIEQDQNKYIWLKSRRIVAI